MRGPSQLPAQEASGRSRLTRICTRADGPICPKIPFMLLLEPSNTERGGGWVGERERHRCGKGGGSKATSGVGDRYIRCKHWSAYKTCSRSDGTAALRWKQGWQKSKPASPSERTRFVSTHASQFSSVQFHCRCFTSWPVRFGASLCIASELIPDRLPVGCASSF